jgi:glucose/arabinose dehydrogenase
MRFHGITFLTALAIVASASGTMAAENADANFVPPKPAFPEQTKAPAVKTPSEFNMETLATGLNHPWAVAFLPDGKLLVTEREGFMRTIRPDGVISAPIEGLPGIKVVSAEGLHDVALDPDFAHHRLIYFTYFAPPPGEAPAIWPNHFFYDDIFSKSVAERRRMNVGMERVARARLSDDDTRLEHVTVLLDGPDRRIVFAPDGTMFITGADRPRFYDGDLDGTDHPPMDLDIRRNYAGRVSHINTDGSIPADNPFLNRPNVDPDVYSFGHRDPEGAAINPATGELWAIEHGPRGGDEVNIIRKGRDYGWPVISYGRQYSGEAVNHGLTAMKGMEQPIYFWVPSIAPSGMAFYTGDLFPDWKGNLFIGALAGKHLVRLVLKGDRVVGEESLLADLGQRIRDVRQGPDGALYVLTDGGSLLKLTPKK